MGNPHSADLSGILANVAALNDLAVGDLHNLSNAEIVTLLKRYLDVEELTVALFQANPGTGTMTDPECMNDGDEVDSAWTDDLIKYCEVDLGNLYLIKQFRITGTNSHTGDGVVLITYKSQTGYRDWTSYTVKNSSGFGSWVVTDVVLARYIRLIATTLDTNQDRCYITEIEVKY